jgi:hypothetical protein
MGICGEFFGTGYPFIRCGCGRNPQHLDIAGFDYCVSHGFYTQKYPAAQSLGAGSIE